MKTIEEKVDALLAIEATKAKNAYEAAKSTHKVNVASVIVTASIIVIWICYVAYAVTTLPLP